MIASFHLTHLGWSAAIGGVYLDDVWPTFGEAFRAALETSL